MKPLSTAVVLGLSGSLLALSAVVFLLAKHQTSERAQRLHDFCLATKISIGADRRDLLSDDPDRQRTAAKHFWSKEIYHGEDSLAYCMDEEKVPQMPLACPLAEDEKERWKCLAHFASKVEQALP
jgi:hypothetical protein